jgi:hypothetical protein
MHHHNGTAAVVVGQFNYLGQQAKSGVATNTALLPSMQRKRGCGFKQGKNCCPIFYFVMVVFSIKT